MTTLSDVARRAGVSVSLVSRVLNEDPALRVREDTRKRVLRVAAQMRYTANHTGRALRLSRSGALAMIVPDVNNAIFAELSRGVEDEADDAGYMVLLGRAERVQPDNDMLRRLVGEGRVDGCLLQRRDDLDDKALEQLLRRDFPVVIVNSASPRGAHMPSSVMLDDAAGARVATNHLLEQGHRRIGIVSGVPASGTAPRRERGFREALRDSGIRRREEWTTRLGYTADSGRDALRTIMSRPRRPTAVFVANVNAAFGVLAGAHELGIDVPGELSVIAFHDDWFASYTWPPLTAVRLPLYEMGRRGVRALIERLGGADRSDVTVDTPAPELVIRSSTAPPQPDRARGGLSPTVG